MRENIKRGQMGGPNNFSCGGQFLEKWFKYAILPTLNYYFLSFGGAMAPPVIDVAPPLVVAAMTFNNGL